MHPLIVIPARLGSARIPGKPLSKIDNEPLIAHVSRKALDFDIGPVIVATDDPAIEQAVTDRGMRVVRTRSDHQSGTMRVAEVAEHPEFSMYDRILNIQGDQLFLPEEAAVGALQQLDLGHRLGTAAAPLLQSHEPDRNRVKVAVDEGCVAISFSRQMPPQSDQCDGASRVLLHLGVYSYTREALREWMNLAPCTAEFDQGLEQLRPFLSGIRFGVAVLNEPAEPGIDTTEDLNNARKSLALTRTNA